MKFIIASHNKKKLLEMERILSPLGIEAVTDRMLGIELTEAEETGTEFFENAEIKALSAMRESSLPAIADDSGLCVDYLNGAPGVYSARYSGTHGDDEKNIEKLLSKMKDVPEKDRGAHFACAICLCFPDGRVIRAEGKCFGKIGFEKKGSGGFGYDPIFMVGEKSFAELSKEEKDEISHRGIALRKLKEELLKLNYNEE